jgi:hypothetical protein
MGILFSTPLKSILSSLGIAYFIIWCVYRYYHRCTFCKCIREICNDNGSRSCLHCGGTKPPRNLKFFFRSRK